MYLFVSRLFYLILFNSIPAGLLDLRTLWRCAAL